MIYTICIPWDSKTFASLLILRSGAFGTALVIQVLWSRHRFYFSAGIFWVVFWRLFSTWDSKPLHRSKLKNLIFAVFRTINFRDFFVIFLQRVAEISFKSLVFRRDFHRILPELRQIADKLNCQNSLYQNVCRILESLRFFENNEEILLQNVAEK